MPNMLLSDDQAKFLVDAIHEEIARLRLLMIRASDWAHGQVLCQKAREAIEEWERVIGELEAR